MLNTLPIGDNVKEEKKAKFEEHKKTWQLIHARNIGFLIEYHQRVEPDGFPIDGESEYAEWKDNYGGKYFGMRHR